jgi:C_GCAxxG_C_C family probable redox protein
MNNQVIEHRDKAVALFKEGYNCAQAVLLTYCDEVGLDPEIAKSIAAPFGGGTGRLREMCGAASAMYLIMGLKHPHTDPGNKKTKTLVYEDVQRTATAFKREFGSYICADILQLRRQPQSPESSDRNAEYYAKRPCARCVAVAATIVGHELFQSTF